MTSLATKLGLDPGRTALLLDAPDEARQLLSGTAPAGVDIETTLRTDARVRYDLIFYWPRSLDGLAERFAALEWRIAPYGALWVVMLKKAFAAKHNIAFSWEEMQAAALSTDLVDNKIASISGEEYATRFVIRRERRHLYL